MARSEKSLLTQTAKFLELAFLLPAGTVTGLIIGYLLDKLFGTHFLYIVFLILGTISGFVQFFRQLLRNTRDDDA